MKKKVNKSLERTKKLALSSIICAFCFVIMYIGAVSGIFDLCAVIAAAMAVIVAVIEIGGVYPWLIWIVSSVLCILFLPDKYAALEFAMFGGIYPMVKAYFERFPIFINYSMKILFFNIVFAGSFAVATYVFGIHDVGFKLKIPVFILANVFFIMADVCFSLLISIYITKIRPRTGLGKKN